MNRFNLALVGCRVNDPSTFTTIGEGEGRTTVVRRLITPRLAPDPIGAARSEWKRGRVPANDGKRVLSQKVKEERNLNV